MKNKELIRILQAKDPEAEIVGHNGVALCWVEEEMAYGGWDGECEQYYFLSDYLDVEDMESYFLKDNEILEFVNVVVIV